MVPLVLLWVNFALAANVPEIQLPASGTLRPGPGDTPEVLQAFEAAGKRPNASDSITFSRNFNNTPETWT
jgi:hypothetical protein